MSKTLCMLVLLSLGGCAPYSFESPNRPAEPRRLVDRYQSVQELCGLCIPHVKHTVPEYDRAPMGMENDSEDFYGNSYSLPPY